MSEPPLPKALSRDALVRILDASQKLAASFDLMELLDEVVQAGKQVLAADRGSLWLYDAQDQQLVLRIPASNPEMRVPASQGLVGECLSSRAIINVPDAYQDKRFSPAMDHRTGYTTRSILSIPLLGRMGEPVGVMQLLNKRDGIFDGNDEALAMALAAQCAVALQRTQMTEALRAKERMDEEVAMAREIQMSTLPETMPLVPGYDMHGIFLPAEQTGGDTFDLVLLNERLFLLMGDATGHGFGPALSATQMQAMLRVAFRCGANLAEAFTHVNNQLVEDLPDDRFVTAFMGLLNPATHHLDYYSGGQGPLLFYRAASGRCEWRGPSTFPLGVMEIDGPGALQAYDFEPGDILALLSDGIYEYLSAKGMEFGQDGVAQWLVENHHLGARECVQQLQQGITAFGAGAAQLDDVTIVLLKRLES
jgi:sigma-B regulation protein RsbU (phosphoserine phosphatase)